MRRARGFTLLEVLVAFALLGTAAVVLLGLLSNGLRDIGRAERVGEATLHARSLLDNAGRMERLRPGTRDGQLDGGRYRWRLVVTPEPDPLPAPAGPGAAPGPTADGVFDTSLTQPVLYRLDLELRWGTGEGEVLRLRTLRALYPLPDDA